MTSSQATRHTNAHMLRAQESERRAAKQDQINPLQRAATVPPAVQRISAGSQQLRPADVLYLQRSIGNGAVAELMGRNVSSPHPVSQGASSPAPIQRDHLDTGLGKQKAVERYTAKVKARFSGARNPLGSTKQWATLNDTERQDKLLKYINAELSNANVPKLKGMVQDPTAAQPAFDYRTWTMRVAGNMSRTDAAFLRYIAYTIYHEARHTEQYFRMARKLAGDGQDAATIAGSMYIPLDIAEAAVKRPLSAQGKISKALHSKKYNARQAKKLADADAWHASVYGAGSAARAAILTSPHLTPGTAVWNQYLNLPEEVDAYATQHKVEQEYDS